MWFRRDLRLRDHPALRTRRRPRRGPRAVRARPRAVGRRRAGASCLAGGLAAVARRVDGRPVVRPRRPAVVGGAADGRAGRGRPGARDQRLHALRPGPRPGRRRGAARTTSRAWRPGTPYAVAPGTVVNGSGSPYKVFTPYSKAWRSHGWDDPVPAPRSVEWVEPEDDQRVAAMLDKALREAPDGMPTPGEDAAWRRFRALPGPRRRRVRRPARRPRGRPDVAALALPEVRRPAPAPAPRRDRSEAQHRARRPSRPSWPGATSTPTCSSATPTRPGATSTASPA